MSYLLTNYVTSDQGRQYDNDPESIQGSGRERQVGPVPGQAGSWKRRPTDNLSYFLNDIKSVGKHNQSDEQSPDGLWGPRTNNSLNNAAAFAKGMVSMFKEMKFENNILNDAQADSMSKFIPPDPKKLSLDDSERATRLLPYLNATVMLFKTFRDRITTGSMKDVVGGKTPMGKGVNQASTLEKALGNNLERYKAIKDSPLNNKSGQPIAIPGVFTTKGQPVPGYDPVRIRYVNLENKSTFSDYLKNNIRVQDGADVRSVKNGPELLAIFNTIYGIVQDSFRT